MNTNQDAAVNKEEHDNELTLEEMEEREVVLKRLHDLLHNSRSLNTGQKVRE